MVDIMMLIRLIARHMRTVLQYALFVTKTWSISNQFLYSIDMLYVHGMLFLPF